MKKDVQRDTTPEFTGIGCWNFLRATGVAFLFWIGGYVILIDTMKLSWWWFFALTVFLIWFIWRVIRAQFNIHPSATKSKNTKFRAVKDRDRRPDSVSLYTNKGELLLNNPFRGSFIVGGAGSGKTESIANPLLQEFIGKNFSGVIYDFKFPTLAENVERYKTHFKANLKHYFINFNNPINSYKINPLNPRYIPNSSYAQEYAQSIVVNLIPESIKKPDFWTRSATDLLSACIWYLKAEHPYMCDLPHVLALVLQKPKDLLLLLQQNDLCANMTMSIYNAYSEGAEQQLIGVLGTLQGAVAKINTPELMSIFAEDECPLDINDPQNPTLLTVGSYPTLAKTFAPLCSLIISVATKMMNQEGKHKSFVLIDELPTLYIPNLEILPNTGRSNKIASVFMCQDLSQLDNLYGKEQAQSISAGCANHFYGRVASVETSEEMSKAFGKELIAYNTSSQTHSATGGTSFGSGETIREEDLIPASEFRALRVGEFCGVLADSNVPLFRANMNLPKEVAPLENSIKDKKRNMEGINEYYSRVRQEVKRLIELTKPTEPQVPHVPFPEPPPSDYLGTL